MNVVVAVTADRHPVVLVVEPFLEATVAVVDVGSTTSFAYLAVRDER